MKAMLPWYFLAKLDIMIPLFDFLVLTIFLRKLENKLLRTWAGRFQNVLVLWASSSIYH